MSGLMSNDSGAIESIIGNGTLRSGRLISEENDKVKIYSAIFRKTVAQLPNIDLERITTSICFSRSKLRCVRASILLFCNCDREAH
jgi:hypothetical protein